MLKRYARPAALVVLALVLLVVAGQVAGPAGRRADTVGLLVHAHEAEVVLEDAGDADEQGVRWMVAAGYDPRGAARLFRRIKDLRGQEMEVGDYFESHPKENVRLAHLKERLTGEAD